MIHRALGNNDKETAWPEETLTRTNEDGTPKPSVAWNRRLTLELLHAETEHLLGIAAAETTPEQVGAP